MALKCIFLQSFVSLLWESSAFFDRPAISRFLAEISTLRSALQNNQRDIPQFGAIGIHDGDSSHQITTFGFIPNLICLWNLKKKNMFAGHSEEITVKSI